MRPAKQIFSFTPPTRFDRKDKFDNDNQDLSNHSTWPHGSSQNVLLFGGQSRQTPSCDIILFLLFINLIFLRKVRREFEHK